MNGERRSVAGGENKMEKPAGKERMAVRGSERQKRQWEKELELGTALRILLRSGREVL